MNKTEVKYPDGKLVNLEHHPDGKNITIVNEVDGTKSKSTVFPNKLNDTFVEYSNGTTQSIKVSPEGLRTVKTVSPDKKYIVTENPDGSVYSETINDNDTKTTKFIEKDGSVTIVTLPIERPPEPESEELKELKTTAKAATKQAETFQSRVNSLEKQKTTLVVLIIILVVFFCAALAFYQYMQIRKLR